MLNFSKFRQTDSVNLRGQGFKCWLWVPLLAILQLSLSSCFFFDDPKYEKQNHLVGFASDTTAIIFSYDWESTSGTSCGIQSCGGGYNYFDIELKLVDVRFKKVYWKSKIDNYGNTFSTQQWSDSAIVFSGRKGNFLWEIGKSKPQKIDFWNSEEERDMVGIVGSGYDWLRWKNDSILLVDSDYVKDGSVVLIGRDMIIDTKTRTVNKHETTPDCINWWGKEAGAGCLVKGPDSCGFSLLSEQGDTLSSYAYIRRYFVFFRYDMCSSASECNSYPIKVNANETISAYIHYDEKGNFAKEPSFWFHGDTGFNIRFVNSLGNVTEY